MNPPSLCKGDQGVVRGLHLRYLPLLGLRDRRRRRHPVRWLPAVRLHHRADRPQPGRQEVGRAARAALRQEREPDRLGRAGVHLPGAMLPGPTLSTLLMQYTALRIKNLPFAQVYYYRGLPYDPTRPWKDNDGKWSACQTGTFRSQPPY